MRLLVLGIYRNRELAHPHPLLETLAAVRRQHGVTSIGLGGLDDDGVISLMEAAAGHALGDDIVRLAHALSRETDGNPFFVTEVLRHLAETGAIHQDSTGRWVAADSLERLALPASVRVVIGARVGRLGRDAQRVLSLAAVVGRDFDVDVLTRASGTAEDELLDILDAAMSASLVRELTDTPGHYAFAHALIQHALYEDLGLTRRARSHRQVAVALEELCGNRPGARIGELARHWSNTAQPVDRAKALDYSRRAADAALAALAPTDALHYYTRALDLYARLDDPDPILGIDLAIGLGIAQRQTGEPASRDTLLDAARRAAVLDDTERLVAAALANNRGMFSVAGSVDTDRVEILELALGRLPARHPSRALVLAKLSCELAHVSLARSQDLAHEAVALARSAGDDATIVRVFGDVCFSLSLPQLLEESLSRAAEALRRAERVDDPVLLFWAAMDCGDFSLQAGDIDEMNRCFGIGWSIARRLDEPTLSWYSTMKRAMCAQLAGDIDTAEAFATEAFRVGTDGGQPDAADLYGFQTRALMMQRGTIGATIPRLEQLTAEKPEAAEQISAALAHAYVPVGRVDDAQHLREQYAASDLEQPTRLQRLETLTEHAAVTIACRDTKMAASLFGRLAPFTAQLCTTGLSVTDPVSYFLGGLATVLGRYDEADAYFAYADALNERAGATYFTAHNNLAWAKMLAERNDPGDTERARALVTTAHAVAAAHGYTDIERGAAETLDLL